MAASHFKGCPVAENTCPRKMFSIYVWNMISYLWVNVWSKLYLHVFEYFIIHCKFIPHLCYLSKPDLCDLFIMYHFSCSSIDTMFVCNLNGQECCRAKDMLNRTDQGHEKQEKLNCLHKKLHTLGYTNVQQFCIFLWEGYRGIAHLNLVMMLKG